MPEPSNHSVKFIDYLQRLVLRGDRGALAALRRGLSGKPGTVAETYPYVVPWLPEHRSAGIENAFFLVASLFASHPEHKRAPSPGDFNFGDSFAALRAKSGSVDKRFLALLASPTEDLAEHLRHAVSLLKAHVVPVDYAQLLDDLIRWNWESRSVQRSWARSFWRETAPADTSTESDSTPAISSTKE